MGLAFDLGSDSAHTPYRPKHVPTSTRGTSAQLGVLTGGLCLLMFPLVVLAAPQLVVKEPTFDFGAMTDTGKEKGPGVVVCIWAVADRQ